jgi:small subunit ribosomal protein S2
MNERTNTNTPKKKVNKKALRRKERQAQREKRLREEDLSYKRISIKTMLESGTHFGHHKSFWNPKMAVYLYGTRNDVHIINLENTLKMWRKVEDMITKETAKGKTILFVGTKLPARDIVQKEAERCGFFYMTNKWPGGVLTNFDTIRKSVKKMVDLEEFLKKADSENSKIKISKKERLFKQRELDKLIKNLNGIREMKRLPDMVFVVDAVKDHIAVEEAKKLGIPVIGLADSNIDPAILDYPIPANDDARGTINLFVSNVAEAALSGRQICQANMDKIAAENEEKAEDFILNKLK